MFDWLLVKLLRTTEENKLVKSPKRVILSLSCSAVDFFSFPLLPTSLPVSPTQLANGETVTELVTSLWWALARAACCPAAEWHHVNYWPWATHCGGVFAVHVFCCLSSFVRWEPEAGKQQWPWPQLASRQGSLLPPLPVHLLAQCGRQMQLVYKQQDG